MDVILSSFFIPLIAASCDLVSKDRSPASHRSTNQDCSIYVRWTFTPGITDIQRTVSYLTEDRFVTDLSPT